MGMKRVGTILFVVGLVLAVILGATADLFVDGVVAGFFWGLVVFGLLVGGLNSAKEETEDVLYTAAVVVLVGLAVGELARLPVGDPEMFGIWIEGAGRGLIAYAMPVALVAGGKRIYDLGVGF